MKYLSFISISVLAAASLQMQAAVVDVSTPGTLKNMVQDAAKTEELTINGSIDATDLFYIADNMPRLKKLVLNANIAEYSGEPVNSQSYFAPNTIPSGTFAGSGLTQVVLPATLRTIGDAAFSASSLSTVTVPASVTLIGTGAFSGCTDLGYATVNASVLGEYTFSGCTAMTSVAISGVDSIPMGCFSGCTALAGVNQKASYIGADAFKGCTSLTKYYFPGTLSYIGRAAFINSGLKNADLSSCAANIRLGAFAFAHCSELESATLPEGVTLSQGIFLADAALTEVNIQNAVTIPSHALTGAPLPDSISFNSKLDSIGALALQNATGVRAVHLPESLKYIGDYAMEGMTDLELINAADLTAVPDLGENVWAGVDQPNVKLYAQSHIVSEMKEADQWQYFNLDSPTSIEDNIADPVNKAQVKARFNGDILEISASGTVISSVMLYNTAGALLDSVTANASDVKVNTSHLSERLYIVTVTLEDGTVSSLKLLRNV
ncbi:MAG: leucine-rich repeat protein [Muribaculaceae bacterium]|nr:leucine-rich repeat protein [Muribaculaceae bacterium]